MKRTFIILAALLTAVVGQVTTSAPDAAAASHKYSNCTQAHEDGRYDIPKGDPDYWSGGDRDGDGVACES